MLFKSGLGQKQGVGGWGRGGMWSGWVGGLCGVGGWGGGGKGWVGGGGGGKGWVGGVGVGRGGLPPLPTHLPLRFTREQTRVEYIRRCRLIKSFLAQLSARGSGA